jgi:hypothetical protein
MVRSAVMHHKSNGEVFFICFRASECVAKLVYMLWGILEGRRGPVLTVLKKCGKFVSPFCSNQYISPIQFDIQHPVWGNKCQCCSLYSNAVSYDCSIASSVFPTQLNTLYSLKQLPVCSYSIEYEDYHFHLIWVSGHLGTYVVRHQGSHIF